MKIARLETSRSRAYVGPQGFYLEKDNLGAWERITLDLDQIFCTEPEILKVWDGHKIEVEGKDYARTLLLKKDNEQIRFGLIEAELLYDYSIQATKELSILENLDLVSFCTSSIHPKLSGIKLDDNYLVATDLNRLTVLELESPTGYNFTIPIELAKAIKKLDISEAKLEFAKNLVVFDNGDIYLVGRVLTPEFVDWKKIPQEPEIRFQVEPEPIIEALEKMQVLGALEVEILGGEKLTLIGTPLGEAREIYKIEFPIRTEPIKVYSDLNFLLEGFKIGEPTIWGFDKEGTKIYLINPELKWRNIIAARIRK